MTDILATLEAAYCDAAAAARAARNLRVTDPKVGRIRADLASRSSANAAYMQLLHAAHAAAATAVAAIPAADRFAAAEAAAAAVNDMEARLVIARAMEEAFRVIEE